MTTTLKTTLATLAIGAALVLNGCGGGGSSASSASNTYTPVPFDAPPIDEATKQAYLDAINAARAVGRTCGEYGYFPPAPPVEWSDALYRAAAEHNYDMVASGVYSHYGSGTQSDWTAQVQELGRGSEPGERIINNGVIDNGGAENIAMFPTSGSINDVVKLWLDSPAHCMAIMTSDYNEIGLSKTNGENYDYWTLELSKR